MTNLPLHSPSSPDNTLLVELARREMGTAVEFENFSRDFGRPSIVWRLTASDGSRAWLKHHESRLLYERELTGLELFVPALGEQTWWSSPTLVAKDDEIVVILMTEVEGDLLDTASVAPEEIETMHRLAGRFVRKLHDAEVSAPDGLDGLEYLRDRLDYYLGFADGSIDAQTLSWTRDLIKRACSSGSAKRVPCHMDFSPRNWLIQQNNGEIGFGIIDWERARWDVWLNDAQRMAYDDWHRDARLRDAYFEGYGRVPSESEELQLNTLCLVGAIASIPWAISHHDDHFENLSREMIERIRTRIGS